MWKEKRTNFEPTRPRAKPPPHRTRLGNPTTDQPRPALLPKEADHKQNRTRLANPTTDQTRPASLPKEPDHNQNRTRLGNPTTDEATPRRC